MSRQSVIQSLNLAVEVGADLLDSNDAFIQDISEWLVPKGSDVEHNSDGNIHGSCRLVLSEALLWESQRVRPHMTLTDQITGESYKWNLGVYLLETPSRTTGLTPMHYTVDGLDKLVVLDTPYGATYSVDAGAVVLSAVEALIDATPGAGAHAIEQDAATQVTAVSYLWLLDSKNTTLQIINDLLALIGYRPLYVDRNGTFRSGPLRLPSELAATASYDTTSDTTSVSEKSEYEEDIHNVPNKWVFVRDHPDPDETLPSEGDGIYTVVNQSDGPTSIDSRGRVVSSIHRLDAADHAALVTQGDQIVAETKLPAASLQMTTTPDPRLWHGDVVTLTDSALGFSGARFVYGKWKLPLDGGNMGHRLSKAA